MTKGQATRQSIIEKTAAVFNRSGYAGATMAELMDVAGLKKGGIYNHFESKEQLAKEAVGFALRLVATKRMEALNGTGTPVERIKRMISSFRDIPLPGGCPLLNTAIDSDDGNLALRDLASSVATRWHTQLNAVLREGVRLGDLRLDVDTEQVATIIISSLEGALMLNRLIGDERYLAQIEVHLHQFLDTLGPAVG